MIEWPLVFVAGLLGSAHCLGMCGGFALAIGAAGRGWSANLARQSAYTAGRVFTYATLGTAAGFGGGRLEKYSAALVNVPAILAIAAGALLAYQGLLATGIVRRTVRAGQGPCVAKSFFASFLASPGAANVFLAGLFTGFLPCGLLYGMLALAASHHEPLLGAATMFVFGLGTAPAMMLVGCGGSLISLATRKRLLQFAAWCLIVTGAISIARGAAFFGASSPAPANCPFCSE